MNKNDWNNVASDYDENVYSITRWKEKRERILKEIKENDNILILGCGSEVYLQQEILNRFNNVTIDLEDFSEDMIKESKRRLNDLRLSFRVQDMMKMDCVKKYDLIISTNSILMDSLEKNNKVFSLCHKALKDKGSLVSYLPSYDSVKNSMKLQPEIKKYINIEDKNNLVIDPVDGTSQSFHSKESILNVAKEWSSCHIEKISCSESEEEFEHFKSLYGSLMTDDTIRNIFEYFIVLKKSRE